LFDVTWVFTTQENLKKGDKMELPGRICHFALDDTIDIIEQITNDKPASIFDIPVLAKLKEWNKRYSAKFTLYLFYAKEGFQICQMPAAYKKEWSENRNWLRLSFHGGFKKVPDSPYMNASYEDAKIDFENVKKEILRFAGAEVWDNFPRTHYCSGNYDSVRAWRDCGIDGTYYIDKECYYHPEAQLDTFDMMYFNAEQREEAWKKEWFFDDDLGIFLIQTNLMMWDINNVAPKLERMKGNLLIEAFCDDYNVLDLIPQVEYALKWCENRGHRHVFPEEIFKKE
jgi:hypothetical protein